MNELLTDSVSLCTRRRVGVSRWIHEHSHGTDGGTSGETRDGACRGEERFLTRVARMNDFVKSDLKRGLLTRVFVASLFRSFTLAGIRQRTIEE